MSAEDESVVRIVEQGRLVDGEKLDDNRYRVVLQDLDGEIVMPIPDEIGEALDLQDGSRVRWEIRDGRAWISKL